MTMVGSLTWKQRLADLCPLGIASECDEEVRPPIGLDIGHGILCLLVHVPGTTNESRGEDAHLADIMAMADIVVDGISQVCIVINSEFLLVTGDVCETLALDLGIGPLHGGDGQMHSNGS